MVEVVVLQIGVFELYEIKSYINLEKKIQRYKRRIIELEKSFYEQSMTTRTTGNELSIYSFSFSPDKMVIPYLDAVAALQRTIERLQKRKGYFDAYINTLNSNDQSYLYDRYRNGIPKEPNAFDATLFEEILEINEAISYMYGYPQDIRNDMFNNQSNSIDRVNKIANLLGV